MCYKLFITVDISVNVKGRQWRRGTRWPVCIGRRVSVAAPPIMAGDKPGAPRARIVAVASQPKHYRRRIGHRRQPATQKRYAWYGSAWPEAWKTDLACAACIVAAR